MKSLVSKTKLVFCLQNHMKLSLNRTLHVLSFISIQSTELLHKSFCRTWKKPFLILVLFTNWRLFWFFKAAEAASGRLVRKERKAWPWEEGNEGPRKRARNIRKAFALVEMDEWSCIALCIDGTRLKGLQIINCGPMVLSIFACAYRFRLLSSGLITREEEQEAMVVSY